MSNRERGWYSLTAGFFSTFFVINDICNKTICYTCNRNENLQLTPTRKPFIFRMKIGSMVDNKEELRKKVEETRWKEMVRDAISLRNKSPQETLKMMFELCEFTQKLRRAVNEKL